MPDFLPKTEIISGRTDISTLMHKGRWGSCGDIKFCFLFRPELGSKRIMVSVPKKLFKRAVRRNLLKRRIRESYRTQKGLLTSERAVDVLFVYNTKEVLDSPVIKARVADILAYISSKA